VNLDDGHGRDRYILHIIPHNAWEAARGGTHYAGDTLAAEGFIHFSTPAQVLAVANARFRGHNGLRLLVVDAQRLHAPLKWEPPFEGGEVAQYGAFPHLYGELNLDAVVNDVPFEPDEDGTFTLPPLGV
jgi:uncharacterized protein (DUF952 family)